MLSKEYKSVCKVYSTLNNPNIHYITFFLRVEGRLLLLYTFAQLQRGATFGSIQKGIHGLTSAIYNLSFCVTL